MKNRRIIIPDWLQQKALEQLPMDISENKPAGKKISILD